MVVSALFISMSIFMIAIGDSYQGLFVEQNLIECSPSQASDSKWFKDQKPLSMIQIFFDIAQRLVFQAIVLLQIFEWKAIIYIVEIQIGRDVGQIMYDHQAENMTE
jgi:hypothetical protein